MPSARKTAASKGRQQRVQVRDLKPKKNPKGGLRTPVEGESKDTKHRY